MVTEFSYNLFETLHRCYKHIGKSACVLFFVLFSDEKIIYDKIAVFSI